MLLFSCIPAVPAALRHAVASALIVGSVALAVAPAQSAMSADAQRTCAPPHYPGTGYFTTLTVNGTSCRTGRALALAYYRCRTEHGAKGRCHRAVLGYTCREKRTAIPTEIDARVTCRRRAAIVVHTYQQDT
jgi:hypothetical protein